MNSFDNPLWQTILKQNFTCLKKLWNFLEIAEEKLDKNLYHSNFSLNLPYRLAEKISKNDLNDPILRQFLPFKEIGNAVNGFSLDPLNEHLYQKSPNYLHKYKARALLITTGVCAMHCQYCFRQNYDYQSKDKNFAKELAIITNDLSLKEVILSGGDPLSLSNRLLNDLLLNLNQIPHLERIRFHTRFPIGIPERIDEEFLAILKKSQKQIWFVIHCNHGNELDETIFEKLKKIMCLGIPVLNQMVLLKGVNDSLDSLKTLYEKLINQGIFPYYLHQLDQVKGAERFVVLEKQGLQFIEDLKSLLPGYAIPAYVKEIPGPSKWHIKN